MNSIKLYGGSDDLVEQEGTQGVDEFNCYNNAKFLVGPKGAPVFRVYAIYDGCWGFAIVQMDEDLPVPYSVEVRTTFGKDCPYSASVEFFDVPSEWLVLREDVEEGT